MTLCLLFFLPLSVPLSCFPYFLSSSIPASSSCHDPLLFHVSSLIISSPFSWLFSSCRAELIWSTTGSCPAQLPDPNKQDHFSTQDHIHSHLLISSGIFFSPPHWEINQSGNLGFRHTQHTQRGGLQKEIQLVLFIEQNGGGRGKDQLHLTVELHIQ